ncbi:MAG TPA: type II toxin-antitoxin system RelE/ParE family toxin [Bacteroidia bacterium]|nr:type II toxin-antitoxin system RelE/ParE family toxin [Bacteroidia bacterium]
MAEVKLTNRAIEDIIAIGEYIGRDSLKFSKEVIHQIFDSIQTLELYPEIGRIVPELNSKKFREIILGNYRIIYFVLSKSRIDILTVHHVARFINKRTIRKMIK